MKTEVVAGVYPHYKAEHTKNYQNIINSVKAPRMGVIRSERQMHWQDATSDWLNFMIYGQRSQKNTLIQNSHIATVNHQTFKAMHWTE